MALVQVRALAPVQESERGLALVPGKVLVQATALAQGWGPERALVLERVRVKVQEPEPAQVGLMSRP